MAQLRQAFILAGGRGERLRPSVGDLPKVLAPVRGRPFILYLLEHLGQCGIEHVVLCVGYQSNQVLCSLGAYFNGMHIEYSLEREALGTGGALRNALQFITGSDCLLLNGDSFCDIPLDTLRSFHRAHGAAVSLGLVSMPDVSRYGSVRTDEQARVNAFVEKGSKGPGYINSGVYVLERTVVESIPDDVEVSLEREILPFLVSRGLYGFVHSGRFIDIGTPESLNEAESFFGTEAMRWNG